MFKANNRLEQALTLLDDRLQHAVMRISQAERCRINELRLRRNGFLGASAYGREYLVSTDGKLCDTPRSPVRVLDEDIEFTFKAALSNSLHSFEAEIRQGFVTAGGGNRVGFCGKAVLLPGDDKSLQTLRDISSVNIRIASELIGCSDAVFERFFSESPRSMIVAGPPASGKTTLLRDLCRNLSGRWRVSLIDERNELAAVSFGKPQNDLGPRTDVFTYYPKLAAITTAVRVMSPQIIVCDEIGAGDELVAYEYALNSGVKLVVSAHASSAAELKKRPVVSKLIKQKAFDCAVLLGTGALCGKAIELFDPRDMSCLS